MDNIGQQKYSFLQRNRDMFLNSLMTLGNVLRFAYLYKVLF